METNQRKRAMERSACGYCLTIIFLLTLSACSDGYRFREDATQFMGSTSLTDDFQIIRQRTYGLSPQSHIHISQAFDLSDHSVAFCRTLAESFRHRFAIVTDSCEQEQKSTALGDAITMEISYFYGEDKKEYLYQGEKLKVPKLPERDLMMAKLLLKHRGQLVDMISLQSKSGRLTYLTDQLDDFYQPMANKLVTRLTAI